jgi:hypothetical protein
MNEFFYYILDECKNKSFSFRDKNNNQIIFFGGHSYNQKQLKSFFYNQYIGKYIGRREIKNEIIITELESDINKKIVFVKNYG